MKRLTLVICVGVLLFAGTAIGQNWTFDKILYDQGIPIDDGYGIHGVVVAPDGNIWICMNGAFHEGLYPDDWFLYGANQDTAYYRPLYILDPTTGDHVSFSPLKVLIFPDGTHDTLHTLSPINGSGKGISLDNDGNILSSSWSTIYRINYQTGEGMNCFFTGDAGLPASSLTEPVQDANGLIYCSYVSGSGRPIFILDNDFNYIGNAADNFGHINRTFVVSPDGKDLYAGSTWNGLGIEHWHSDIPGILQYTPVDTFGNWDSVYVETEDTTYWAYDVKLWPECLDWGSDGTLWAGATKEEWVTPGTGSRWFVFDVTTKERLYSVGYPDTIPDEGGMMTPRGAAWSADGKTMYLADYNFCTVGVWSRVVGVEDRPIPETASAYKLSQNYPNPFNLTTTISFTLLKNGFVELKVFDIAGREVATLISQSMDVGNYGVPFDASGLTSGIYYYRMTLDGQATTKKMLLVK